VSLTSACTATRSRTVAFAVGEENVTARRCVGTPRDHGEHDDEQDGDDETAHDEASKREDEPHARKSRWAVLDRCRGRGCPDFASMRGAALGDTRVYL
jgi:hypothetical protein